MKVLFVLDFYHPHLGGAEVLFRNLAEALAKRGHHIDVVTQKLPGTRTHEVLNSVHIHRVVSPTRYLFTVAAIPVALRYAKKADIVHTTTFNAAPAAWLAARLRGKNVLITVHEVWADFWGKIEGMNLASKHLHALLERMIYLLSYDAYACVSASTQRELLKMNVAKEKTAVVYNGVDYAHFSPRRKKAANSVFTVLATGRPGVSKGMEYLVDAVPLVQGNVRLRLMLGKDPAYKKQYTRLLGRIAATDRKKRIEVAEPVPWEKLPEHIAQADAVCVPSLSEGFGYAAAEACAMGIPVIATNTTSLPEVVSGKFILVTPGSAKSLARGIEQAMAGKWQKKPLKKFTVEDNVRNYLELYKSMLRKA